LSKLKFPALSIYIWFMQIELAKALVAKYPTVDPAAMGCPQGWQQEPLWK